MVGDDEGARAPVHGLEQRTCIAGQRGGQGLSRGVRGPGIGQDVVDAVGGPGGREGGAGAQRPADAQGGQLLGAQVVVADEQVGTGPVAQGAPGGGELLGRGST